LANLVLTWISSENLELIERGELKRDYSGNNAGASDDDEEEDESLTPMRTLTPAARNNASARQATTLTTTVVGGETIITTTPVTMSQIRASLQQQHLVRAFWIIFRHATAKFYCGEEVNLMNKSCFSQQRVIKQDGEEQGVATDDQMIDLAQLGQANYLCHPNGTFTLSFTGVTNQSTTPLIIRRTPVK